MKLLAVPLRVEAHRKCEPYTAHSCRYAEIRNSRTFFSVILLSRLSSGNSLPWKGFRGVYCELSWLALEPAVWTRILDSGEASSKF